LALFLFKSAFGQFGSLDKANTTYRNELVNYLLAHNMTVNNTQLKVNELMNIDTLDIYELEAVVRGHKNDCQSGTFNRLAVSSNLSNAKYPISLEIVNVISNSGKYNTSRFGFS
jgi:hypothetical protein